MRNATQDRRYEATSARGSTCDLRYQIAKWGKSDGAWAVGHVRGCRFRLAELVDEIAQRERAGSGSNLLRSLATMAAFAAVPAGSYGGR